MENSDVRGISNNGKLQNNGSIHKGSNYRHCQQVYNVSRTFQELKYNKKIVSHKNKPLETDKHLLSVTEVSKK